MQTQSMSGAPGQPGMQLEVTTQFGGQPQAGSGQSQMQQGQSQSQSQSQSQQTNQTSDRSLISDKELHYLKDFMSWELLAAKKCGEFALNATDPQISELIRECGRRHQQHFDAILQHLQ